MEKLTPEDKKLWDSVTESITPTNARTHAMRISAISPIVAPKDRLPLKHPVKRDYQRRIDLHSLTKAEAFALLSQKLPQFQEIGIKKILVITGKGENDEGALKVKVPLWLESSNFNQIVRTYEVADRKNGGEGALFVYLKSSS